MHEISDAKRGYSNPAEKAIGTLRSELEYADINDVFKYGLHEYLDQLQRRINDISTAVYEQYFKIRPNFAAQAQDQ